MNDFDVWLAAKDFDPATLSDKQKQTLQAQWRAEGNGTVSTQTDPPEPKRSGGTFSQTAANIAKESERVSTIEKLGEDAMKQFAKAGATAKVEQIRSLTESAVGDESTSVRDFKYELIQLGRADTVSTHSRQSDVETTGKMLEAAFCRRAGLDGIEKSFDARTLEDSEKQFKNGLTLVGLLQHSAERHGWRGMPDVLSKRWLQHAMGQTADGLEFRAGSTGPSTYSLPNIVGAIANKYLKAGFLSVENAWSRIAYLRSVNDLKTTTGVRLNGATIYKALAPGGEIKHALLTETAFTNRAAIQAIMVGISQEDLINDDVNAFTELSKHVGRGAGLRINELFWTPFLNNSSFFAAGNNNVSTGAGSALGTADGAAINAAEVKFINQTDPNGYPLGVMPKMIVAPPTLVNTARRWMGSFGMVQSGTAGLGDSNIFNGRYSIETGSYMENSLFTGNSAAAWYLLADPNDVAVIEGVALNNRWEPQVDTAEADFNQLGISMRGWIAVGFAQHDFRGGVRSAGS